jgi:tetratricopeptide (TPR) repeat protein
MRSPRRKGFGTLVGTALLLAGPALAERAPALEPVPFPPASALEPAVAAQLAAAESSVSKLLAAPGTSRPDLAEAFGEMGQLLHAYELWDSAAAAYRNARLLAPGDYRWSHLLAGLEARRGDLAAARKLHEAALAIRPGDVPSLVGLGEACLGLNRLDASERAFREAASLSPGSAAAHAGLARVSLVRRAFAAARDELLIAARLAPEANRLRYELAMAYRGLGDRANAARQMAAAGTVGVREADPLLDGVSARRQGERAHLVRGRLAFVNGRMREAAEEFGAAVAAEPRSVAGLVGLGSALGMLGESDRALAAFARAIALDPGNVSAHYNAGRLHAARGDTDAALREFDEVIRLAPQDDEARRARAEVLARRDASPPRR